MKKVLKSMRVNVTGQLTHVNNYVGNSHRPARVLELTAMDTKNNRLINLRRIINDQFGKNAGACADKLEIKRPQMSRWVTENEAARQGISEESARGIEAKLGLRRGSLDEDPDIEPADDTYDDVVREFAWLYSNVTETGRHYLRMSMDVTRGAHLKEKKQGKHKAA